MKTIAKLLALAALLAAPLFAQPSGNTLPRNNPTFGGVLTGPLEVLNQPGIATTSTDALMLQNVTAATVGVPVQYSPRLHFVGHAWNLTATAADNYLDVIEELRPASASVPTAALTWSFRRSTAGTGSFVDFGSMEPNSTTGGLLFKALGTNQSITLTPSGTADVNLTLDAAGGSENGITMNKAAGGGIHFAMTRTAGTNSSWTSYLPAGSTQLRWYSGADRMVLTAGGNLLLGGLTTDGTGVLQLPAGASDKTSGITFNTTTSLYSSAAGVLTLLDWSGGNSEKLILGHTGGLANSSLGVNGGVTELRTIVNAGMTFYTNNTLTLTLDSSQNYITAAGHIAKFTNDTTTSITLSAVHDFVTVSNAVAVTVNLPALASNQGRVYHIKNVGAGTATLDPNSSENLFSTSAVATYALATGDAVEIIAMPSWWAIY